MHRSQILGQLKVAGFIRPRGAGDIKDLNTNSNNFAVVKVFAPIPSGSFVLFFFSRKFLFYLNPYFKD